jgi:hypothetical protein
MIGTFFANGSPRRFARRACMSKQENPYGVGDCWIDAATFETSSVVVKSRHTRTKSCYALAKSYSLATESTSTIVRLSSIATGSIFIVAESSYDVGGSCCKILATHRLSNQHHICQNKLLATHKLCRIKLCPRFIKLFNHWINLRNCRFDLHYHLFDHHHYRIGLHCGWMDLRCYQSS